MYGQMKRTFKHLKIPTPKTKYLKQRDRYFAYSHKRRKSQKEKS